MSTQSVAAALERALTPLLDGPLPVHLTAWDGSTAGPKDAPHVELTSPAALRRVLRHPGELGAAQAYVTGQLRVHGSLIQALDHVRRAADARGPLHPSARSLATAIARVAQQAGVAGLHPLPPPATQIAVTGRLHSRRRDRQVIAHHYDLPHDFYRLILDEHMAYSCGYVTGAPLDGGETGDYQLEDAQADKLDLVCTGIGLDQSPGMRLLDIGCGWGALSLHAAQHYGAHVTGVTISHEQKAFIDQLVIDQGLQDRVTIRLQDYRDVHDDPYDAIACLEMGEHAGERGYPDFVRTLSRNAGPHTLILIQQMSRRGRHLGGGPFIEAFIAPDMTMRPLGKTIDLIEDGGLDVLATRSLREHYAWTIRAWRARFEAHRHQITALVGEEVARVWDLYLAGGQLAFEQSRMGVDQIIATPRHHPDPHGKS